MPPSKINVLEALDRKSKDVFHPFIVGDVQRQPAESGKVRRGFDWRAHEREDEAVFVLRGRIASDFCDGVSEMGEGDCVVVPRGSNTGRGRARRSTGDALTVRELDRL